jgi:hypothetical protein
VKLRFLEIPATSFALMEWLTLYLHFFDGAIMDLSEMLTKRLRVTWFIKPIIVLLCDSGRLVRAIIDFPLDEWTPSVFCDGHSMLSLL